ncbi:hypothetical protein FOPG_19670 [Fusarium oxysporum f. sp. conglutinans race 2 54008]|uniref:Uncharacterized protein n=1 Tax=Fusarium oxysporum f. sp. conglutinans race 2 54008 TaxID=1089457 RepID=X0GVW4_FUSOX|nr:hypothetical protein FOPG_19670 [Fusarium oxysporum f. sp. conglutinans race 2 54008]
MWPASSDDHDPSSPASCNRHSSFAYVPYASSMSAAAFVNPESSAERFLAPAPRPAPAMARS